MILEDLEELRQTYPEEYQLLHGQGIHSLVAAPMELDGQLFGLVGVDNPPPERIRSIASLLQTLCYFLMLAYRRTEDEQKLYHLSYYDTLTSFYIIEIGTWRTAADSPICLVQWGSYIWI